MDILFEYKKNNILNLDVLQGNMIKIYVLYKIRIVCTYVHLSCVILFDMLLLCFSQDYGNITVLTVNLISVFQFYLLYMRIIYKRSKYIVKEIRNS